MRRRIGWSAVAAGAVGTVALWAAARSGAQTGGPRAEPLRVAVVNMKQVSDTVKRTQDLRSVLEKHRGAKLDELRKKTDDLKNAQKDLTVLVKDSASWKEQNAKVMRLEVEARIVGDLSVKELQAENLEYTSRVYDSVLKEIDKYAKDHGIDLVLRTGESEVETPTLEDLYRKMAARVVLYAAPPIDISEDIRRAADKTYEAEGGK